MFIRSLPAAVLYTIGASLARRAHDHSVPRERAAVARDARERRQRSAACAHSGNPTRLRSCAAARPRVATHDLARRACDIRRLAWSGAADRLQPVPKRGHTAVPDRDRDSRRRESRGNGPGVAIRRGGAREDVRRSGTGSRTSVAAIRSIYYNVTPRETRANVAEVFTELKRIRPARKPGAARLELRAVFDQYPAARITVKEFENGPPIAAPIAIRVTGPELDTAARARCGGRGIDARHPGYARRAQPGAVAAHGSRPRHRHRQSRASRRAARRERIARCASRSRASRRAATARPTATSTTSPCVCQWTAGKR